MLDLMGVGRRYRGPGAVLRGVDLRVVAGAPAVVLGANGSGKSTLLRVAAGVTTPTTGRVRGRPAVVGYLPAPFPAASTLSVRTYLRHLASMRDGGCDRGEDLLDLLGFVGRRDVPVAELSTGNAQKVGLAQAMVAAAGLVVLDEPWNGLDHAAADVLDRWLADLAGTVPVLVADHTGRAAELPAARVRRLHDGRLEDTGPEDTGPEDTGPDDAGPEDAGPNDATGPRRSASDGVIEVEVWCPAPTHRVLAGLPEARAVELPAGGGDGALRVVLAPERCDAWVAAALARGCSLRGVRPARGRPPAGPDEGTVR